MQTCGLSFVIDLDLGIVATNEFIDGAALGGTHVGGCNDSEFDPTFPELFESGLKQSEARPANEGTKEIDRIGGFNLSSQLGSEIGILFGVGEERGLAQFCGGAPQLSALQCLRAVQREELRGAFCNVVGFFDLCEEPVRKGHSISGLRRREGFADDLSDVSGEKVRSVVIVYFRHHCLEFRY